MAATSASAPATRRGRPPGTGRRNRRSEGQKKRWALKKTAEVAPPIQAPQKAAPQRKVRFTPEGRERLAEAMRRRWAVKRAASAVKKAARKKHSVKKAA
jgi:hypothetical protein